MIILEPRGGLGNRLYAIKAAYYLSKELNEEFKIIWISDYSFKYCKFEDLFKAIDGVEIIYYDDKNADYCDKLKLQSDVILNMNGKKGFNSLCPDDIKRFKGLDLYIKGCHHFYNKGNFDIIKPHEFIIEEANKIITNSNVIGMNIRIYGYTNPDQTKISTFEDFISNLIHENSKVQIFLTCDDNNVTNQLKNKFNNHIITSNRKYRMGTKEGMIEATIDFYCLTKCKEIYSSKYTTFSQAASKISNKKHYILQNND